MGSEKKFAASEMDTTSQLDDILDIEVQSNNGNFYLEKGSQLSSKQGQEDSDNEEETKSFNYDEDKNTACSPLPNLWNE